MIIALLLVIVLILLFGAGVVQGWLANLFGIGCGGLVLLLAVLWLGPFIGENGVSYILLTVCGLFGAMAVIGLAAGQGADFTPTDPLARYEPPTPEPPSTKPPSLPRPRQARPVERVWQWFADDIAHRFTPEAQTKARALYESNDALGLDRFCRDETKHLRK